MLLSTSCGILQVSSEKENKGKNNFEFGSEGNEQVNGNDDIKVDVIINNKNSSKIVDGIQGKGRKQLSTVQAFKENDIKARKIKDTSGEIEYEKLVEDKKYSEKYLLIISFAYFVGFFLLLSFQNENVFISCSLN